MMESIALSNAFAAIGEVAVVSEWVNGLGSLRALEGYHSSGASQFVTSALNAPAVSRPSEDWSRGGAWMPLSFRSIHQAELFRSPFASGVAGSMMSDPALRMMSGAWECLNMDARTMRSFDGLLESLKFVSEQEQSVEYGIAREGEDQYVVYRGGEDSVLPGLMGGCYLHTHCDGHALPSFQDLTLFFRQYRANPNFFSLIYSRPADGQELSFVKPTSNNTALILHWRDRPKPYSKKRLVEARRFEANLYSPIPEYSVLTVKERSPSGGVQGRYELDPYLHGFTEQEFWERILAGRAPALF